MPHIEHLLPTVAVLMAVAMWAVVVMPRLMRSASEDGRLLAVLVLYIIGVGQTLLVVIDPDFEHVFATAIVGGSSGSTLHNQTSRLIYVLGFFLTFTTLLGAVMARRGRRPFRWWVFGFVGYTLWDAIGGFMHGDSNFRPLLFPALIYVVTRSREGFTVEDVAKHLRIILRLITIGSLVMLFLDKQHAIFTLNNRTLFGYSQLYGLTPHPNVLGPTAALGLAVEVLDRNRRPSIIGVAAAVSACLLAQSRAGWLCGAVVLMCWAWQRARWLAGLVSLAGLGVYLSRIFVGGRTLLGAVGLGELGTLNGRQGIWTAALDVFHRNPVLGGGPDALRQQVEVGDVQAAGSQAHNQLLQTLAADGAVGAAWLGLMVIAVTVRAFRHLRSGQVLPFAAWMLFVADSTFEANMHAFPLPIFVAALIAARTTEALPHTGPDDDALDRARRDDAHIGHPLVLGS